MVDRRDLARVVKDLLSLFARMMYINHALMRIHRQRASQIKPDKDLIEKDKRDLEMCEHISTER